MNRKMWYCAIGAVIIAVAGFLSYPQRAAGQSAQAAQPQNVPDPLNVVLAHAEWSLLGGIDCANFISFPCIGGASTASQLVPGVLESVTDAAPHSLDDTTDTPNLLTDLAHGLNRSGAFMTARARWVSSI